MICIGKAVVFDLDGTLVDTLPDVGRCIATALLLHGLPARPWQEYRRMIGGGIRQELARVVPPELLDSVVTRYTRCYEDGCMIYSKPYPGAGECLRRLEQAGFRLGVITNKRDVNAKRVVANYFSGVPMELVWGRSKERPMKPNPASGYALCEALDLPPDRILFVGDGPETDIAYAKTVGLRSAGVSWGYRDRAELAQAQPDYIADSFEQLTEWVLSWRQEIGR